MARGDGKRDECIETVIKMLPIMQSQGITTICFNFMAHIGWLRTADNINERGDALVTGFNLADFKPTEAQISAETLWDNYAFFKGGYSLCRKIQYKVCASS